MLLNVTPNVTIFLIFSSEIDNLFVVDSSKQWVNFLDLHSETTEGKKFHMVIAQSFINQHHLRSMKLWKPQVSHFWEKVTHDLLNIKPTRDFWNSSALKIDK